MFRFLGNLEFRRGTIMGREYALRASFLFASAGVLATTSLAHAIDPYADARQSVEQEVASQVKEMAQQVTRMQDQIAKINGELAELREKQLEAQEALRVTRELGNTSAGGAAPAAPVAKKN
jgi:TolA-binding protein